jgi:hypothetical protein
LKLNVTDGQFSAASTNACTPEELREMITVVSRAVEESKGAHPTTARLLDPNTRIEGEITSELMATIGTCNCGHNIR